MEIMEDHLEHKEILRRQLVVQGAKPAGWQRAAEDLAPSTASRPFIFPRPAIQAEIGNPLCWVLAVLKSPRNLLLNLSKNDSLYILILLSFPHIYYTGWFIGLSSLFNSFILSQIEKLFKYNLYDILLSIYAPYAFIYRALRLSSTICIFKN